MSKIDHCKGCNRNTFLSDFGYCKACHRKSNTCMLCAKSPPCKDCSNE